MRITLTIGDTTLAASLNAGAAAESFAALLPLTVSVRDFHHTEKIADLPARLDTTGAPAGTAARTGDLTYYSPWGNLAIFYRDFEHSPGLVSLGRIEEPLDALAQAPDGTTITITRA
ncbi:cyclophilin-like fold protein [Cellulosimicrobium sp. TH-20]|uniref:cyclophilin-like fold protein n=1 Tax=Cellulosimicrobium sp. TH-20 TaxID=1980001 RepID=UPI00119CA508|nr:cyclophilin-like fold protein [Cellulosimicrobium sp. TH-20]